MVTIREALTLGIGSLKGSSPSPELDAELLLFYVTGMSRLELIVRRDDPLENEEAYRALIKRRASGEPVAYLTGEKEFMSLPFTVSPAVLIPRPDTETLAEWVISHFKGGSVLDIGTGSGCLAISIAHYVTKARVTALDISDAALDIARKNAEKNHVSIRLIKADILNDPLKEQYDLIVSNPPYIAQDEMEALETGVRDFEPHLALYGGADGLDFYRVIVKKAYGALHDGGTLAVEIGWLQEDHVCTLFQKTGFRDIKVLHDLADNPRVVIGTKSIY